MEIESPEALAVSFLKDLREGLRRQYGKKREGAHVSDLSLCQRRIVFNDLNTVDLTNQDINNFSSGAAIGAAIEQLAGKIGKYKPEAFTSIGHFINGHIDILDTEKNIPIELKSYRGKDSSKLPKQHNIDQIKSYIAGTDAKIGFLVYQLLMDFQKEQEIGVTTMQDGTIKIVAHPFVLFAFVMTDEEKEQWRKKKIHEGLTLVQARALGMPALATHVMDDKDLNWLCRNCPFFEPCQKLNMESELRDSVV